MMKARRTNGKQIRRIAKLDRAWRIAGRPEGQLENRLAFELGNATRRGLHRAARRAQCRSAARLGERSGWER